MSNEETPQPEETEYTCPHCGKVYKTLGGLQKHIDKDHRCESEDCVFVDKDTVLAEKLGTGLRIYHLVKECKYCGKKKIEHKFVT